MIKEHPDKKKHWDMLDDRIKEFFPTFFGLPDKVKFDIIFKIVK